MKNETKIGKDNKNLNKTKTKRKKKYIFAHNVIDDVQLQKKNILRCFGIAIAFC